VFHQGELAGRGSLAKNLLRLHTPVEKKCRETAYKNQGIPGNLEENHKNQKEQRGGEPGGTPSGGEEERKETDFKSAAQ